MKTTKRLWPFVLADNKLAEEYLEKQARKGRSLERISAFGLLATYQIEEPQNRRYCVDGFKGKKEEQGRYIRMAKDAGWQYITEQPGYIFFTAEPGTNPVPTQTDWKEEYLQIRKALWIQDIPLGIFAVVMIFLLGALFGWLGVEGRMLLDILLEWETIRSYPIFIFILIGFIKAIWFYLKSEIALRRDVPMKLGSMRAAMAWGHTRAVVGILWLLGLWYNFADILTNDLKTGINLTSAAIVILICSLIVFLIVGTRLTKTDELGRKVFKSDKNSKRLLWISGGCLTISSIFYMFLMV